MNRFATLKVAVVVGAISALPAAATAQDARPLLFWTSVQVIGASDAATQRKVPLTANGAVATPLLGWTCRASKGEIDRHPEAPRSTQTGVVACASASGTVRALATCSLTGADDMNTKSFDITDAVDHEAVITVGCQNMPIRSP